MLYTVVRMSDRGTEQEHNSFSVAIDGKVLCHALSLCALSFDVIFPPGNFVPGYVNGKTRLLEWKFCKDIGVRKSGCRVGGDKNLTDTMHFSSCYCTICI